MIGNMFYIFKCAILSILFIGILQIKVQDVTLESKLTTWFYSSTIPKHIQAAAAGGALLIEQGYHYTRDNLHQIYSNYSKNHSASLSER